MVLTGNNLTEESVGELLRADLKMLKNLYLSKNQIFGGKIKGGLRELRERYNVYIWWFIKWILNIFLSLINKMNE